VTTTTNLGLTTYDTASGSATTFQTFRLAVAGNSSNMVLIDNFAGTVSGSILSIQSNLLVNVNASVITENYYEATVSGISSYLTNSMITLKLNAVNTGAVTLNINSLGIITLKKIDFLGNLVDMESGDLKSGRYALFVYNGTYYVLMGTTTADQISISGISGNWISISGSGTLQDSGISGSSVLFEISGSGVMSDTTGSSVKHNVSGITTGSYNKILFDVYGHAISGSIVAMPITATGVVGKALYSYDSTTGSYTNTTILAGIAGSGIMSTTTGSQIKHNASGVTAGSYVKVNVDVYGHVTSGSASYVAAPVPIVSKTSDYSLLNTDYVCLVTGSSLITLPTPVGKLGLPYIVKNSGSMTVSVITAAGLIDSASQVDLTGLQSVRVISDNSNWWKI
jgi:hypothetical protein